MRLLLALASVCLIAATACGASPSSDSASDVSPLSQTTPSSTTVAPGATSSSSVPSLAAATATVSEYVRAYDHHRLTGLCALQSSAMQRWEEHLVEGIFGGDNTPSRVTCKQAVNLQFVSFQDNPSPSFKHLGVAAWHGRALVGDLAAVRAAIHVQFPSGPAMNDPQITTFYLTAEGGHWKMLDQGDLSGISQGAETQVGTGMTPLTPGDLNGPIHIPAPTFTCTGKETSGTDTSGDVHDALKSSESSTGPIVSAPWLDIRHVALYDIHGSHPCAEITFAAPIHAGTLVQIDSDGTPLTELALGEPPDWQAVAVKTAPHPYGEHGTVLRIALEPGLSQGQVSVCAIQPLYAQPLVDQISAPQDGWAPTAQTPTHCG